MNQMNPTIKESDFWLGVLIVSAANVHPIAAILVAVVAYFLGRKAYEEEGGKK